MTHCVVRITSRASRHTSHVIYVIRTTSHASRKTAHVLRHSPNFTRFTHHASRITVHITRYTSHATRHMPNITNRTTHAPCHTNHVTRQTSRITRHTHHASHLTACVTRFRSLRPLLRLIPTCKRFTIKFAVVTRHKNHITPRTSHAYTSRLMHHSELHTSPITRHNADGTSRTLYLSFALIDKRFALATRCSL